VGLRLLVKARHLDDDHDELGCAKESEHERLNMIVSISMRCVVLKVTLVVELGRQRPCPTSLYASDAVRPEGRVSDEKAVIGQAYSGCWFAAGEP